MLLDDILSALDVHTSRWIVDQCLAGDLLKGRTVILVTHNVLLASSIAEYMIVLNPNGSLQSQGPVEKLLREDNTLKLYTEKDLEDGVDKEPVEDAEAEENRKRKGKQIVSEELAIGHVDIHACDADTGEHCFSIFGL